MNKSRYKRVCHLVRELNKRRRVQEKKIDILCNDMVSAHGEFIARLKPLVFGVSFYESILGCNDLSSLLDAAGKMIGSAVDKSNVAVFLLDGDGFQLHITDGDRPIQIDAASLENCFSTQVVRTISRGGRVFRLEEMFEMGLEGDPEDFNKISAAGIPLNRFGRVYGFVLIYRVVGNELNADELAKVAAITPGLCNAIGTVAPSINPANAAH
ncbi:MAG: hypothetical protein J7M40_09340 [Planctomycetes bacterium]|nr:hypothetical protein [Planctomycetota bacterium]